MQTIKTAAIVVLLMSVIYGAYVSLTTPPEPLPADVEDMLVMNERGGELAFESALPPSLGELGINTGSPDPSMAPSDSPGSDFPLAQSAVAPGNIDANSAPSMQTPSRSAGTTAPGFASLPQTAATEAPATDQPMTSLGLASVDATSKSSEDQGYATTFSDRDAPPSPPMDNKVTAIPASYPNTGRTFQMPDPQQLDASLIGGQAQRIGASGSVSDTVAQVSATISDSANGVAGSSMSAATNIGLANAIGTADRQYQNDQRKEALATLSIFYGTPNLSGEQRSELLSRLDPLAAEVIYSGAHLLERPYRVQSDESLIEIAERYEVPWQLLANINQVRDPVAVLPGTELKVVKGPFRAEVDLKQKELTLFLGDLYAGRFPVEVGDDPVPKAGTFTVQDKQNSRTYYDRSGAPVPPDSPDNPYGNAWIDLGGNLCIHGSPNKSQPSRRGCISLAADYASDLYGILSQGSSVTIR